MTEKWLGPITYDKTSIGSVPPQQPDRDYGALQAADRAEIETGCRFHCAADPLRDLIFEHHAVQGPLFESTHQTIQPSEGEDQVVANQREQSKDREQHSDDSS